MVVPLIFAIYIRLAGRIPKYVYRDLDKCYCELTSRMDELAGCYPRSENCTSHLNNRKCDVRYVAVRKPKRLLVILPKRTILDCARTRCLRVVFNQWAERQETNRGSVRCSICRFHRDLCARITIKKNFAVRHCPNQQYGGICANCSQSVSVTNYTRMLYAASRNHFEFIFDTVYWNSSRQSYRQKLETRAEASEGAYVRPLLEYANPVVYSGRTKDVILIERVQRAATKMVAGLKSMDYETRLVVLDLFPLEYRRLRGDLILTYALFEQGLAN
ncbi:pol-related protein, partial [Clonorchis sinensis]